VFSNITDYNWLYIIDLIYFITSIALMLAAFIGFLKWRSFGLKSFFLNLLVQLAYCLVSIIIYAAYGLASQISTTVGSLLGVLIYTILLRIYYKKRKLLFAPYCHEQTRSTTITPSEGQVVLKQPTSPFRTEPQIMYCRKCGTALPSDSLYCNKCGMVVIAAVHDKNASL
jgi:hypothetical protein